MKQHSRLNCLARHVVVPITLAVLLGIILPAGTMAANDSMDAHHGDAATTEQHTMEGRHDVVTGEPFPSHEMDTTGGMDHDAHGAMTPEEKSGKMDHDAMTSHDAVEASNEHMPEAHMHESADTDAAAGAHDHAAMEAQAQEENLFKSVGLDEKLGDTVPLDISFKDETGRSVTLSELVDRPTLLQLVFYHCPQTCNMMMASLAGTLPAVTFKPGKDYRVITISFDHEDTPKIALETKKNYMNILPDDFPAEEWRFLTGDLDAIGKITRGTGFRFKRIEQHNFIHPNVLIVLGEDGKVIRYLYGVEYLPFEVSMALTEAARGTPAISIKKLLTFCFDYDPKGKRYVFRTFRIAGIALLLGLGLFFLLVLRKGNK